ncbi:MAG: hypothetical protein ACRDNO_03910 [Trebonia sp.]
MAAITLVKGESPALDRTWMSMPDGSTRQVAVHVVHDLPHLVVESLFGIEDGLWGVLARGGFGAANLARTRSRGRRSRLVTDEPLDDLGARNWRGHLVAKAATNAVMNRWQEGPDTPDGVRARLRPATRRRRITGSESPACSGGSTTRPLPWPSAAPGISARPGPACPRAGYCGCNGRCRARPRT